MRGTDLVVAIGADQQNVARFGLRDQALEQLQRAGIQPLQIIDE